MTDFRMVAARVEIGPKRVAQFIRAIVVSGDFQFDPKKIHSRGRDEKARDRRRNDDVAQCSFSDQHVVTGSDARFALDAETGRSIALGIKIDNEDALADRGEGCSEVDGGGCLADPALLVRHDENARPRSGAGLAIERMGRVHGLWVSTHANSQDRGLRVEHAGKRFDCVSRRLRQRRELILS